VDVSHVANVSEVYVASTFRVDPEDGGSMYLQNISNIIHNQMV
jgi:hypothetical protein